jgi:hypothetical protein
VHGQSGKYNQYIFDGLVGKEVQHQTNIFAPSIDAIQEIRIQTSNYSAEFGGEAGGHINVVTKAGANQFHGTLFEFLRNTKFNAREKFADSRAQLNRNTFGGTIGGPIRRDKTFFFGAWDSMRLRQGFTQNTTVPTPEFRRGDFSSLLRTDASNANPIVIYDWTTGAPFPNNIIPAERLHPLAASFQQEFVPLPNRQGRGGIRPIDNYQSLAPQQTRNDQFITRLDHHFNSANRIYGRYIISDTDTLAAPVWPAFSYNFRMRGQHAVLNYTRTLSPTTVYEFRTGYSRFRQNDVTESAFNRNTAAELGLRGACADPQCWHAPLFQITDFSSWGTPSAAIRRPPPKVRAAGRTRSSRSTRACTSHAAITSSRLDSPDSATATPFPTGCSPRAYTPSTGSGPRERVRMASRWPTPCWDFPGASALRWTSWTRISATRTSGRLEGHAPPDAEPGHALRVAGPPAGEPRCHRELLRQAIG